MKLKKTAMLLCTAALACTMSFPAFAAQTKAEYRDESAQTRQELETMGNEISRIKDENKTSAAQCKETRVAQKEAGRLKENKDAWKQVKELKNDITGIQVSYTDASGQVRLLKAQARADAAEGRYDEALAKLDQALDQKKEALNYMEQIQDIWDQIDQLIQ